ncbi:MAG: 1-deoxy-D-xylulose-5-phosphate reductoisomerase [bacterium]
MKKIIILGSCGSIGTQTLDILSETNSDFKIEAISIGRDLDLARNIIKKYSPNLVCARTKEHKEILENEFNNKFVYGDEGLIEVACYKKEEEILLVSALVGSAGLKPTVEAIKIKRNIALANKETLVMAGDIVMDLARKKNVKILPLDSEHSAIWQCLSGEKINEVKKMIITASGGALRDICLDELENVSLEQVLNHPNWSMGKKITVDSATMMNKGFEVIEAHHLFNIDYKKIETIMHKESIIHSMVEFVDGQIKAQIGPHNMKLPIIYAINYPNRVSTNVESLDFVKMKSLNFKELSFERFNCLRLAYLAGEKGNIYPTVLNAANEACVELFLNNKIKFCMIDKIIESYVTTYNTIDNITIEKIIEVDNQIKKEIFDKYGDEK